MTNVGVNILFFKQQMMKHLSNQLAIARIWNKGRQLERSKDVCTTSYFKQDQVSFLSRIQYILGIFFVIHHQNLSDRTNKDIKSWVLHKMFPGPRKQKNIITCLWYILQNHNFFRLWSSVCSVAETCLPIQWEHLSSVCVAPTSTDRPNLEVNFTSQPCFSKWFEDIALLKGIQTGKTETGWLKKITKRSHLPKICVQ